MSALLEALDRVAPASGVACRTLRLAPANFVGMQHGPPGTQPLELWNLTENIPGHCIGSTVSRQTLLKAGFVVRVIPPQEAGI